MRCKKIKQKKQLRVKSTPRERVLVKLILSLSLLSAMKDKPQMEKYLPAIEYADEEIRKLISVIRIATTMVRAIKGKKKRPDNLSQRVDHLCGKVYALSEECATLDSKVESETGAIVFLAAAFQYILRDVYGDVTNQVIKNQLIPIMETADTLEKAYDKCDKIEEAYEEASEFLMTIYAEIDEVNL